MAKHYNFSDELTTLEFARKLAGALQPGHIVLLEGDLGAGKTALAREMIRDLANNPDLAVPSPTFTLVQTYETPKMEIWHFDLYRLDDPDEIFELGWEEALSGPLVLIEWPDRLGGYRPDNAVEILLKPGSDGPDSRYIRIRNLPDEAQDL